MKLSKDEVLKIANLARLELSAAEVEKYGDQLSAILDYVDTLNKLDVSSIEPTAHAMMVPTPYRADEVVPDATREKSLVNAPDREETFFKVPKVIG
ncbi:MAG TPA: Asp-tRNA(Asn)/Glu-tRNA(Gln) amidotransferase subunit GatC [bacterium]|nr:Asp-tRNA(Asn)/Glu-tRNA(Gln) amidotransferase subunit GatC [bacterium]